MLDAALQLGKENEWWFVFGFCGLVFCFGGFLFCFLSFLISIQSYLKRRQSVVLFLPLFFYGLIKKSLNVC